MLKYLAVIAMVFAVAQATMPVSGKAPDNGAHDRKDKSQAANASASPSPKTSVVLAQDSDSEGLKPKSNQSTANDQQGTVNITNATPVPVPWSLPNWAVWLGWFANLVLTIFLIWGVLVARKSLDIIKKQTKEAARSAKAAEDAATAALKQANHIETTERAWVIPAPQRPNPPIPKITDKDAMTPILVAVNILFENKGHTPAFIKNIVTGGCAISRNDIPDLSDTKEWGNVGAIPIVPGHSFGWEHERIEIEQAIQIRNCELNLWLYGIIGYSDIFGKERTTGFCFRLEPSNMEWLLSGPPDANWAD